ncbi:MAG: hypothetical protein WCO02_00115 [Bacteroidota bacterium]
MWYVERENNGWSQPIAVDSTINDGAVDYQVSLTSNGTIYFAKAKEGSTDDQDIYYSKLVNGKYSKPVNLGDSINTELNECRVFVSPDESYILFSRYKRIQRILECF